MRFASVYVAFSLTCLLALTTTGVAAEAPSQAQLEKWADALEAGRFAEREVASEQLVKAGFLAVEPVESRIGSGLEATTRGIQILRELALSNDAQTEAAAREALLRLAADPQSVTAKQAATTLAKLNDIRRQRALAEIRRMGGQVATNRFTRVRLGVAMIQSAFTIKIDDKWTGGEEGLAHLKWVDDVQQITLIGSQVNDRWLSYLEDVENLKILKLKDTITSGAGLARLKDLPTLEWLTAQSESLNDDWLKAASQLKNLRGLEIRGDKITQAGVAALATLPQLEQLSIYFSPIADEAIPSFKQMKTISNLKLYGTKVSRAAADDLQAVYEERNPNVGVKVDRRDGAFLGVGCQAHPQGCLISTVQDDSAASRAGIRAGDVITQYDGVDVRDFENLTVLIGKHHPSQAIKVDILRHGTQKLAKEIKLGGWEFLW